MDASDRTPLRFVWSVRRAFLFLADQGFAEVEAKPTVVRYQKGDVEVDVHHGRKSYEIGGGITFSGIRYAMSEIVRASDPDTAKDYRTPVATTPEEVAAGLRELSALMQRYGAEALSGDPRFFSMLEGQRKRWAQEYALDVLVGQLRPQAEEAFRRGDYSTAARLYGRIRERLSAAEAKKLTFAEERSGT
jgi:hypothetical protein